SGWMRFLLERFEFPFEVVYPQALNAGNLRAKYDVIILPNGSVPNPQATQGQGSSGGQGGFGGQGGPRPEMIPEEFRNRLGRISADTTVPQLKTFLEEGGTIISVGSGNNVARQLGVSVHDALTTTDADGREQRLRREQFYVPGSVLEARLDPTSPLAYGMPERVNVMFDESPVFRIEPNAQGVRRIAWYEKDPLRSGWAWGQAYLEHGVAAAEVEVGNGNLFMFGPEITFRAQPHGTFKFLFNSIYYGPAKSNGR
ncbi:MAG TPA: hypothetical protein VFZ04_07555, partial [Longimicrobiales bacterium]